LASQGLISLPAGIVMMLGAEIGTCADTLAATIGRSRAAVRAGLFHLAFNPLTVALGILFVRQLAVLAEWSGSEWSGNETGCQVANAHVAFNVAGALRVIGFVHMAAKILLYRARPAAARGRCPSG
jgi:phosphate:Na+ symporter